MMHAKKYATLVLAALIAAACGASAMRLAPNLAHIRGGNAVTVSKKSSPFDNRVCEKEDWRKVVTKVIDEMPIAGLFPDISEISKFEASGISQQSNDGSLNDLLIVFDSLEAIARVDEQLTFRGSDNKIIGDLGGDSEFEGITYAADTDTYLVVREVVLHEDVAHPHIREIRLNADFTEMEVLSECAVDVHLADITKGLEAVHYFRDAASGERYILGMCEGNHCVGGHKGKDRGNGRMVLAKERLASADAPCMWEVQKTIKVPASANFSDFSGLAFLGNMVAITSQNDSAMWIGYFDFHEHDFQSEHGEVMFFPRDSDCEMIYCNVEGIQFLDSDRIVVVSDRAKANQGYRCTEKDQSIHIMALPGNRKPPPSVEA